LLHWSIFKKNALLCWGLSKNIFIALLGYFFKNLHCSTGVAKKELHCPAGVFVEKGPYKVTIPTSIILYLFQLQWLTFMVFN